MLSWNRFNIPKMIFLVDDQSYGLTFMELIVYEMVVLQECA